MSQFDTFVGILDATIKSKRESDGIRLLNVGTDHQNEHHWAFKTSDGDIIKIIVEKNPIEYR
jgi:hypothetical protein